jgi:hypothetical protein
MGANMLRKSVTAAAMVVALVLGLSLPANAATITFLWTDGFEATPTAWQFEQSSSGSGYGVIVNLASAAHSGSHYALLDSTGSGAWSAVGQPLHLPGTGSVCTLSVYVVPITETFTEHMYLNIEVIDPATWNYIAVTTHDFTANPAGSYQYASLSWAQSKRDVYIRFSLLGTPSFGVAAKLDDAAVVCTGFSIF